MVGHCVPWKVVHKHGRVMRFHHLILQIWLHGWKMLFPEEATHVRRVKSEEYSAWFRSHVHVR